MNIHTSALALGVVLAAAGAACSSGSTEGSIAVAESAFEGCDDPGKQLFDQTLPGTNGRSCATCHVESEHTALSPQHVSNLLTQNPADPLFNVIDADDPSAANPTYNHLAAGLVRVTLPLAANLDLLDANGNVVTNAARTISVWRAVPTVENTVYTAPYQYDDRAATLEIQATSALLTHSQMNHQPSQKTVDLIAGYERTVFSSFAAREIGEALAFGLPPPDVDPHFPPGSPEAAGKALFAQACAPCHGGATQINVDPAVRDQLHPVLNADGSVNTIPAPGGLVYPAQVHHDVQTHHTINIGISFGTYLAQIGVLPNLTVGQVDFPHYRVRFYTDASRTHKLMDLPPPLPEVGPTGSPQAFSVDPGRAIITGDIVDWEAFDTQQLRGIKNTAPYFHDNSAPDLPSVLDIYSRFILGVVPQLNLPRILPPEGPYLPPESLSPTQKKQLLAYLQQI